MTKAKGQMSQDRSLQDFKFQPEIIRAREPA